MQRKSTYTYGISRSGLVFLHFFGTLGEARQFQKVNKGYNLRRYKKGPNGRTVVQDMVNGRWVKV